MKLFTQIALVGLVMSLLSGSVVHQSEPKTTDDRFVTFFTDPKNLEVQLYWKNDSGQFLNSLGNLRNYVESKGGKLIFAMNAGMYKTDFSPLGLFIQNGKTVAPINTADATGNFYLKPNGVFYVTREKMAIVCETKKFQNSGDVLFATQSGPMLVINGVIHSAFKEGSNNLNIRNGVGILPNKQIVFAMSKTGINFYDFARYFQSLGCKNALYLDGFVSRTYLPEKKWIQLDGNFGVMIGVTEKQTK